MKPFLCLPRKQKGRKFIVHIAQAAHAWNFSYVVMLIILWNGMCIRAYMLKLDSAHIHAFKHAVWVPGEHIFLHWCTMMSHITNLVMNNNLPSDLSTSSICVSHTLSLLQHVIVYLLRTSSTTFCKFKRVQTRFSYIAIRRYKYLAHFLFLYLLYKRNKLCYYVLYL